MKKILLFASIFALIISCRNDDDTNETTDTSVPILPIKMTFDDEIATIKYDGSKILNITSDVNSGNKIIFTYNGDVITNVKHYYDNKLEVETNYTYSNGKLVSESTLDNFNMQTSYTYTYVNDNSVKAIKKVSYTNNEYTLNLTYTLSNGNVTSYTGSGSGISNGASTTYKETGSFTYSDKNAIFKNVKGFDKIILNGDNNNYDILSSIKNNILIYKVQFNHNSTNLSGNGWTYYKITPTYNNENYPIKEVRRNYNLDDTPTSHPIEIRNYEYNK